MTTARPLTNHPRLLPDRVCGHRADAHEALHTGCAAAHSQTAARAGAVSGTRNPPAWPWPSDAGVEKNEESGDATSEESVQCAFRARYRTFSARRRRGRLKVLYNAAKVKICTSREPPGLGFLRSDQARSTQCNTVMYINIVQECSTSPRTRMNLRTRVSDEMGDTRLQASALESLPSCP